MWKQYGFEEFRFDAKTGELTRDGHRVAVPPKVAALLVELLESEGKLLSKQDLLERVWPDTVVTEDSLKVRINELRKVLGDRAGNARFIETVVRKGYRFIPKVKDVTPVDPEPWARPSTAVLPFSSLDAGAIQQSLADGLANAVVRDLIRWGELPVVSPRVAARIGGMHADARRLGGALDAALTIEGSVQRAGERVRIAYEFCDTTTGIRLAAGHEDFDVGEPLAIQDRAAARIVNAFRGALHRAAPPLRAEANGRPERAWDYVIRGEQLSAQLRAETNAEARACFLEAYELDAYSAGICTSLAASHLFDWTHGWTRAPDESIAGLGGWAERATELDPMNGIAQVLLGAWYIGLLESQAAERCIRRAIELDPGDASFLYGLGNIRLLEGDLEEARALVARSVERLGEGVLAEGALLVQADVAIAQGDLELAASASARSAAILPCWPAEVRNATAHMLDGNPRAAARALDRARAHRADLTLSEAVAIYRWSEPGAVERLRPVLAAAGLRD